jgi:ectoine hydroxylase-related dioxygenase (phytanoyl-CoA dioxygenase family)
VRLPRVGGALHDKRSSRMEEQAVDSRDALWASDRSRVAVCARVAPLPGVSYDRLREEVFARVEWGDRDLRFHDARRAADAEADAGWVMECTLSCLAHGDEAQVAYRIEGLAAEFVEEADVLVSAPCHIPLLRVTAADLAFDARTGEALAPGRFGSGSEARVATAADLVRAAGLAVAAEALDARAVERALLAVNRRIAKAERALREMRPSVNVGADVFAFREMGSRGGERFDLLFPKGRDPADRTDDADREDEDEDAAFVRELAMTAPWTRTLVEPLLGSNDAGSGGGASWRCDVSVVYSRPGAANQDWHCDGRHLAGAARADFDGDGLAPPYAICVFCPLVDLNADVGFTQFWAGSHRGAELIGFGGAAEVLRGTVDGIVQAGGAVAYDYRTMHRGMANVSAGTTRPVLQFLYAESNYRETKNYGAESLFEPPPQ